MDIDWQAFSPVPSLMGGGGLGLACAILIAFQGRIAGVSGILGALLQLQNTPKNHYLWRFLFVLGLVSSSFFYSLFSPLPNINIGANFYALITAGLLVGFGTRMGSGCTSGHGICGLARLSIRSLVATVSFMGAGFVSCYLFLHTFYR